MKYIIGASIGGLFGLSVPMMMDTQQFASEDDPRLEDSQHVEELQPTLSSDALQHLPDNVCRYLELESDDPKEQAKECLDVSIPAIPAI